jgi:hypothetical protein
MRVRCLNYIVGIDVFSNKLFSFKKSTMIHGLYSIDFGIFSIIIWGLNKNGV